MVKLTAPVLKASTIIESIVAMVIIVASLAVATLIYTNVMNSDKERLRLSADLLLSNESFITKNEKSFLDSEKEIGMWRVVKKIEKYEQSENCYVLSFTAIASNNKVISTREELILIEE